MHYVQTHALSAIRSLTCVESRLVFHTHTLLEPPNSHDGNTYLKVSPSPFPTDRDGRPTTTTATTTTTTTEENDDDDGRRRRERRRTTTTTEKQRHTKQTTKTNTKGTPTDNPRRATENVTREDLWESYHLEGDALKATFFHGNRLHQKYY